MDAERAEQPRGIRVVFVLLAHSLVLDWAGPAEALRIANQCLRAQGRAERFQLRFAGPQAAVRHPASRCAARSRYR